MANFHLFGVFDLTKKQIVAIFSEI